MTAPAMPRRAVLAGLGALPTAILAVVPVASATALTSPDAALIQAAHRVARLARLDDAAHQREQEARLRYEAAKPPPVPNCTAEVSGAWRTAFDATQPDGDGVALALRAGAATRAIRERHAAAVAAHAETCRRLRQETGLERAGKLSDRLCTRLVGATERLAETEARTMAGLMAKSKAVAALHAMWSPDAEDWIADLAVSLAHDVLRVGADA